MHLLDFIHWDPDPSVFGLPVRWYGLLFASSFFFGYFIMRRFLKMEVFPESWLESLTIYMAVSTVVGARLGHCLFYEPDHYLSHPIEILKIWEGGLASHGAAIGIITGLWIWSRRVGKRNVLWILDRIVIMVALSGLTIRAGNLMNSEILGKPTTASYGFVFPRADQSGNLVAKWQGEDVDLQFTADAARQPRLFDVYRSIDDVNYHRVNAQALSVPPGDAPTLPLRDSRPGTKGKVQYLSAETSAKAAIVVSNGDSLKPRNASFSDPFAGGQPVLSGSWEGDRIHLRLDMSKLPTNGATRGTLLLRGSGDGNWQLLHRGVLGGAGMEQVLDTLDTPVGLENPQYLLVVKEHESLLVARQPAQVYEAVAYTIIFVFLYWLYFRKKGNLPLGQHFGLFLVLVFLMRFLIEFGKEEQAAFMAGSPFTMGQWLSIPFVLAGLYFIWSSIRNPRFPEPVPAEVMEKEAEKAKEKEKKKA